MGLYKKLFKSIDLLQKDISRRREVLTEMPFIIIQRKFDLILDHNELGVEFSKSENFRFLFEALVIIIAMMYYTKNGFSYLQVQ
jgi:hypothetical protein